MGSSLSRSLRRYQKISHKTSSLSSFHIRKTVPALCESYSLSALLAQKDDNGHEQTIYYLSRTLIGAESRYNPIEECLALVFAVQKTRHYLVGQIIHVISRVNPLCLLMTKPESLNSRLAKWALLLSQYDMIFSPQKAVKGQALAEFLAAHPILENSKLHEDILDEVFESNVTSEDEVWQVSSIEHHE